MSSSSGAIHGNGLLHVTKQLRSRRYAVILVVAVRPVGAADGLEQVVVAQFVVEVNGLQLGASKPVNNLADHDQQLHVRRLVLESALDLVFVPVWLVAGLQDVPGVGVELATLVAVGRLARDRAGTSAQTT